MKITKHSSLFPFLIALMRILFGIGWLLAGITKITEKLWFKEPGLFLEAYLMGSLQNPNTPPFYKTFIEHIALDHVIFLNYAIPIAQIILGIFLIIGLLTIPSILICLFMHINFILSGNMNVMSLVLYTSAFSLIIFRTDLYHFSLDKYFSFENLLNNYANKRKTTGSMQIKYRLIRKS
jgi:thiosulfate dehydrogenase [quinone] large subunit